MNSHLPLLTHFMGTEGPEEPIFNDFYSIWVLIQAISQSKKVESLKNTDFCKGLCPYKEEGCHQFPGDTPFSL
jgi:hypothetical protein